MNSQYVKFACTEIQYYYSFNLDPPAILESDTAIYKQPNTLEAWLPGRTSGPPSYKVEVNSVIDTRLRYNFLNTPGYTKTREYYYHCCSRCTGTMRNANDVTTLIKAIQSK